MLYFRKAWLQSNNDYCYDWHLATSCFSVDVSQLQTFTHIALMTQCTDGSSVDLLTSLDQVGMKLAPLIFDFQKSGGLWPFMECCRALRREHLSGIPEKVVSNSHVLISCCHDFTLACCVCSVITVLHWIPSDCVISLLNSGYAKKIWAGTKPFRAPWDQLRGLLLANWRTLPNMASTLFMSVKEFPKTSEA